MADRYWVGGTGTWDATSTTNWSATSGGASGASVPTAADAVIINGNSGSPTITTGVSTRPCLSLTTTGATCTIAGTIAITVSGSMTLSSTTTWSNTGTLTFAAASTITTNGVSISSPISITGTGIVDLGSALTTAGTFNWNPAANSTLRFQNFNLTCAIWSNLSSNVRTLTVGTGTITVTGNAGTVFTANANATTFTTIPTVNFTYSGSTGTRVIDNGNGSATVTHNMNISAGSDIISFRAAANNVNTTGFTGTFGVGTGISIFGSFTLGAGATTASNTLTLTFAATTGTQTITTNGITINFPLSKNAASTLALNGAVTLSNLRTFTYTAGTLNLANNTLSTGLFVSTTGTRVVQFGTGNITVIGSGTVFNVNGTSLTYTGTPTVNISNSGTTATTVNAPTFTAANAFDFVFSGGAYTLTIGTSGVRSLDFTNFVGTLTNTATKNIYGNLTIPATGGTYDAGTFSFNFIGQSGLQTINTNGRLIDFPFLQSTVASTVQLTSALTLGTTRTFTLTSGTLNLNNFTLTAGLFSSANSNTRVIQFGTGNITTAGSGTAFNVTATNLTYTGTPTVNISNNSATATTVTATSFTESNALNFNVTVGTYALTATTASFFKSLNFTGFTGTWDSGTSSYTFYGNLTLASGMTYTTPTGGVYTFANTSGTATLTSASKTLYAITASTPGATLAFSGTTTLSNALTFTTGALQLPASTTTTVDSFVTTGTTLKYLTSSTSGTQATISDSSGTNTVTYLSIKDSNATGGATFDASDPTNVNAGNNTGWLGFFAASTGNFFLMF